MKVRNFALSIAIAIAILFSVNAEAQEMQKNMSFIKPVISLTGKIIDKNSNTPFEVEMFILNSDGEKIGRASSNSVDGYFFLTGLEPGKSYTIKIENEKYEDLEYFVVLPVVDKYEEYEKDFALAPKSGIQLHSSK